MTTTPRLVALLPKRLPIFNDGVVVDCSVHNRDLYRDVHFVEHRVSHVLEPVVVDSTANYLTVARNFLRILQKLDNQRGTKLYLAGKQSTRVFGAIFPVIAAHWKGSYCFVRPLKGRWTVSNYDHLHLIIADAA